MESALPANTDNTMQLYIRASRSRRTTLTASFLTDVHKTALYQSFARKGKT
jgi:hypothetical protein